MERETAINRSPSSSFNFSKLTGFTKREEREREEEENFSFMSNGILHERVCCGMGVVNEERINRTDRPQR